MFSKILVANRGEIAVRIIRACKEMGIATVAVYSQADKDALHVALADESYCIGGNSATESYLNENQIISTAILAGAGAIHPGYGFLSENAHFARACRKNGIVFIGPDPEDMERLSDKAILKELISQTGLSVIPGTKAVASLEEARQEAEKIGFPVMLKACAGGGGRGIRLIRSIDDFDDAYYSAQARQFRLSVTALYISKNMYSPHATLNFKLWQTKAAMQYVLVSVTALCSAETKN